MLRVSDGLTPAKWEQNHGQECSGRRRLNPPANPAHMLHCRIAIEPEDEQDVMGLTRYGRYQNRPRFSNVAREVIRELLQVFVEDLPEDEQDVTGLTQYGAGLDNLGNTCYMNSTLQVWQAIQG